jgi:hypothetical protein
VRKIFAVFIFLIVGVAQQLHSQVSLPTSFPGMNIDGVSGFYRVSRLSGASGWRASPTAPCPQASTSFPMCGWGFELVYGLTGKEKQPKPAQSSGSVPIGNSSSDSPAPPPVPPVEPEEKPWFDAELALGYDFLNVHARTRAGANYEMFGSIQTLPSISLYVSHDFPGKTAAYLGIATGFVVLRNARAYDRDGKIYAIAGDTWGLTPSVGIIHRIREENLNHLGLSAFLEGSYEVRDFTSLAYTLPAGETRLPSELPRGLSGSGFVLNVGIEMKFRKKPPTPGGK